MQDSNNKRTNGKKVNNKPAGDTKVNAKQINADQSNNDNMTQSFMHEDQPLTGYSSYGTGGRAKYLALPTTTEQLKQTLLWADALNIPHELLGAGANVLISDNGYDGVVISLRGFENWIIHHKGKLIAGAGALLNDTVKYACDNGLKGLERLAGIPGTIGGAVRMNAGAFGTEMKVVVTRINTLEAKGRLGDLKLSERLMSNQEVEFTYRKAKGLLGKIVLSAEFELEIATDEERAELERVRLDTLSKRAEKQPLQYRSCGSVFKRPEGNYAGTLIDEAGLKGVMIGGAQVSTKHANFIIAVDNSVTSSDIFNLIQFVKSAVYVKNGIMLEEEVNYLGHFEINLPTKG